MCGGSDYAWGPDESQQRSKLPPFVAPSSHMHKGSPDTPHTHLNELPKEEYTKDPASLMLENFSGISYMQAYNNIVGADEDVAPGIPQGWADVSQAINSATKNFQQGLQALDSSDDNWKGATADAALQNVNSSFHIPNTISTAAGALGVLAQAFSNTIATTKADIVSNYPTYQLGLYYYPHHRDQIVERFNEFARNTLTQVYQPNITNIALNNPGFNAGAAPHVGGTNAGSGGPGSTGGGGAGSFGGGGGVPGPVGGIPTVPAPQPRTSLGSPEHVLAPQPPSSPQPPTDPSAPTASPTSGLGDLSGLSSPLQGLASPLQSALGQAAGAAQQGNTGALGGANGLGKLPPEGALGLGPKGLKGGAGGIGGGAGARGVAIG
jgi:hypothetical protein